MRFLVILLALVAGGEALAQGTFQSFATGAWNAAGTWTLLSGSDANGIPDADDNVTIRNGHVIDIDANSACLDATMQGTGQIDFSAFATRTLTVNGTMTMGGTSSVTGGFGTRTLSLQGNFIIPTGAVATIDQVVVSQTAPRTFTILGELIATGIFNNKSVGNVIINSAGGSTGKWSFGGFTFGTWTTNNFTIYDGPAGQALVGGDASGFSGTINVNGTFSVIANSVGNRSKFSDVSLTVNGATSVSGYLIFTSSAVGNKRFNNTITVNPGGTWDNEIAEGPFINCNIVNNGSWPPADGGGDIYEVESTGSYNYTGAGIIHMGQLIVTQSTVTNLTSLYLIGNPDQALQVDNTGIFINGNGGYLTLAGTLDNIFKIAAGATINLATASNTVEYVLAGNQNVFPTTYHKLICSTSGNKTQSAGTVTVNSELDITGSAVYIGGAANTLNGAGNLVMTGTSELNLAKNAVNLPELTGASNSLASGTTINLSGNGAQTLKANSSFAYQNIDVSGASPSAANLSNVTTILGSVSVTNGGAITAIPAGGMTVVGTYDTNSTGITTMTAGNLTVGNIVFAGTGTFNFTGRTITINGNNGTWTNNGITTLTSSAASNVVFTTGTGQQLGGTTATTFFNLTINNSNGVTLNTVNPTVSTALTLTAGALITGTNRVIASSTVARTSGFVQGNLQKPVPTSVGSVSYTYEVGSGTSYAPVTVLFPSVSVAGSFMAGTTAGDHPDIVNANIDPSFSVNRYYSLMRVGALAFPNTSVTFTFVSGDVDVGFAPASEAAVKRYDGTTWTTAATGTRTALTTQIAASLYVNFPADVSRDYQIGRRVSSSGFYNRLLGTGGGSPQWHSAATWLNHRTGSIRLVLGNAAVVGTGTLFTSELSNGDILMFQNNPGVAGTAVTVGTITDDTHLTLSVPFVGTTIGPLPYGRQRIPNTVADSVVIGNTNLADNAVTILLSANATVHSLVINNATRNTAQSLTHNGAFSLTVFKDVLVGQPANAATNAWNINTGSATITGDVTIGSANATNTRIASIVMTTGTPILTIGGNIFFNTNGSQLTSVLTLGAGRVNLAGAITYSASSRGTLTGGTGTFNFNGTTASQSIDLPTNNPASFVFNNIECNNTSTNGVQIIENLGTANLQGNLRILTGKLQLVNAASPTLTGTATKTLEVANGTTLEMLGTQVFPTGFTTYTIGASSTIIYGQTGNMTLSATIPPSYGNLTFSGNPTYSFPAATITVNGNLAIGDGTNNPDIAGTATTTLNVTGNLSIGAGASLTATNIGTVTLQGNWVNNGTFTPGAGTTAVVFGGNGASQPQTIGGTTADTFYRLTLNTNDNTDIVQLSKNISVSNLLTLTKGGLDLNANQLSITNTATTSITRVSPGYIKSETTATPYSRVRWTINTATGSYVYPFGKTSVAADYIPFTLNVTGAGAPSGTFEVSTYPTAANNTPYPNTVTNVSASGDNTGGQVTDRFWILTPAGFTTDPTSTLTFTTTTTEATGIAGNLRAQRWTTGSVWEAPISGQSNPTTTSVTVPAVIHYSPWTLASSLTPLPIELLSFDAHPANGVVELKWETATEINNEYFDVERSQSGEEFITIGRIAGAGNSHLVKKYNFTDPYPVAGNAYYRLRQSDYDGKSTYSWVLRVETSASFSIIAWPNPSDGNELNISWRDGAPGAIFAVRLWTQTGAKAFECEVALDDDLNSKVSFSDRLSSGLYILDVQTTSGVQRMKVVVR